MLPGDDDGDVDIGLKVEEPLNVATSSTKDAEPQIGQELAPTWQRRMVAVLISVGVFCQ